MLDFNEFNLYLIRHGQSTVNVIPDQMGQDPETPLTDHGKLQAKLLRVRFRKEELGFHHIYSSDYTRALDTAKIVVRDESAINIYPALREYDAGDWKGTKRSEILDPKVIMRMGYMNNAFLPPHGESMNQVERRASRWLEDQILYNSEIQKEAYAYRHIHYPNQKHPNMNIAVFSHGMTIKCLLLYVMGFDRNFTWKIVLENTSITQLSFGKEGWKLLSVNDHAHLL